MKARLDLRPSMILDFDLENRPLSYWYDGNTTAEVTAIGWSWVQSDDVEVLLLQRNGRWADNAGIEYPPEIALQMFRDVMEAADMLTGHYIRRHDLPILQASFIEHGMPPMQPVLTQDTHGDFVKRKDLSISQESLADLVGLDEVKHHMTQSEWRKANRLTKEGISAARKRVVDDVIQHKALRKALLDRGLLKTPRVWKP